MRIPGIINILRLKLNILIVIPSQIPVIAAAGLVKKVSECQGEPIYYKLTYIYITYLQALVQNVHAGKRSRKLMAMPLCMLTCIFSYMLRHPIDMQYLHVYLIIV